MNLCIGEKWWNQGYTSAALKLVIDFLIQEVGYQRVEAVHDPNNSVLGKVMLSCGMQFEGTLRQSGMNNQGVCDLSYYAIFAKDLKK